MLTLAVLVTDLVLSITVVVLAAQWAARRTDRVRAILFACAIGAVYSVASDFAFSFLASAYDRSLSSLATGVLISTPICAAMAYFATRRKRGEALLARNAKAGC